MVKGLRALTSTQSFSLRMIVYRHRGRGNQRLGITMVDKAVKSVSALRISHGIFKGAIIEGYGSLEGSKSQGQ